MASRRIKHVTTGLILLILVNWVCTPQDSEVADAAKAKEDFTDRLVDVVNRGLYHRDPAAIKVCVALLYCDDPDVVRRVAGFACSAPAPVKKEVLRLALKSSARAHCVVGKASSVSMVGLLGLAMSNNDSLAYVRIIVEHMDVQDSAFIGRVDLKKIHIHLQDKLGATMTIPSLPEDNRIKMDRAVKLKKEWKQWLDKLDKNKEQKETVVKALNGLFATNPRF